MSAHKTIRRIWLASLVALAALGGCLGLIAEPTAAFVGYGSGHVFGAPGSGNGQFSGPAGVAVDDASGDVYVVDQGNDRVQEFDAEGNYLAQFGEEFSAPSEIAVDNSGGPSNGDVYVIDAGHNVVDKFGPTGTFLFKLQGFAGALTGVAVEVSGDVLIEEASGTIQKFDDAVENKAITSMETVFGKSPGIAVDSEEELYLVLSEPNVLKYSSTGQFQGSIFVTECGCVTALAIDSSTNDVFLDRGTSIARYGPFGEPYGAPPVETLNGISASSGVAVNGQTHAVYASEGPADRVVFFKEVPLPDVTTGAASAILPTGAELEGIVNPDGEAVTSCEFEYGLTTAYGHTAPCSSAPGSGSSPVAVSAKLAGPPLQPASVVFYRLKAGNANGVHVGASETFETADPLRPEVGSAPASDVSQFAATLEGTIQTGESLVDYHFEYGTSTAYGSVVPLPDAYTPITAEPVPVSQAVDKLQAGTTYHYRIVASSPGGTDVAGPDETFTTLPIPPPSVATGGASNVGVGEATLSGAVDPNGWDTSYSFQYGTSTAYGSSWPTVLVDMGAFEGAQPIVVSVPNLLPSTTYHYRVVASNGGGTAYGPDMTFTTGEYPPQIVQEPLSLGTILVPGGNVAKASPKTGHKTKNKTKRGKNKVKKRKKKAKGRRKR